MQPPSLAGSSIPADALERRLRVPRAWPVLALLPGLWALLARPPLPIDETRYLTVAWEMWLRQDWLVPFLNGAPYSHKPPLLFWLIGAGWGLFGVSEWWPRLVNPLLAVADSALAAQLATALWPGEPAVARRVPWLLAGGVAFVIFGQLLFFDLLLLLFVLGAALLLARRATAWRGRDTLALGALLAGGLLAKGPMVFLQVLLPAIVAPLAVPGLRTDWRSLARAWLPRLALAALLGLAFAGLWAIPAALAGGPDYAGAILWRQTAGRMVQSFAHVQPWWFYALALPALGLPWAVAWPALARGARRTPDTGTRLMLGWLAAVTVALSVLSGKQPHYALPLVVPLALLAARHLPASLAARVPAFAGATVATVLALATVFFVTRGAGFDLRAPAAAVARLQSAGAEVAVIGGYHGQLGFLGRLPRPITSVAPARLAGWAATHPGAYVLAFKEELPATVAATLVGEYPYRSHELRIHRIAAAPVAPAGAPGATP